MKLTLISQIATITSLALTSITPQFAAQASPFEQQEVNQEEFTAIARPYGENKYDLLIIRQIPGKQQCWQEMGSNPVKIEPLLLNFNFTGSCERNTDSNGYSLRIAQEDYGLDYLLRIVKRNGELVLIGAHRTDPSKPEIIVGRTHGIESGFLKIDLDPGWQFTKRAYNGQVLGHVYLTADSTALANNNPAESTSDADTSQPITEITFTAEENPSSSSSPAESAQPRSSSPTSSNTLPPPPVPKSTTPNEPPPLPSFSDLPPLPPPTANNTEQVVPPPPSIPNNSSSERSNLGNVVGSLSGAAPAQNIKESSSQGYRVIVAANNSNEQSRVRSLYPEAFSTSYQGRSMLQVGLFSSRDNAEKAHQSLENAGLKAIIIP